MHPMRWLVGCAVALIACNSPSDPVPTEVTYLIRVETITPAVIADLEAIDGVHTLSIPFASTVALRAAPDDVTPFEYEAMPGVIYAFSAGPAEDPTVLVRVYTAGPPTSADRVWLAEYGATDVKLQPDALDCRLLLHAVQGLASRETFTSAWISPSGAFPM